MSESMSEVTPEPMEEVSEESNVDTTVTHDLQLQDYTDKSFVVTGESTKKYRVQLKELGGRFNPKLKCGPGWVFSKKSQEQVANFILSLQNAPEPDQLPTITENGLPQVAVPKSDPKFRWIKYKIFQPREDMKITLKTKSGSSVGKVVKTESSHGDGVIDTAYVDFDGNTSLAVTCRRKWQIYGYFDEHALYFQ